MKNEAVWYQIDKAANISLTVTSSSLKTVTIFIRAGHLDQEKSMISRQLACIAGCVQSFMLAQKCKIGISEFWPKLTFLLEYQVKFV